jgi:hypothetical protein
MLSTAPVLEFDSATQKPKMHERSRRLRVRSLWRRSKEQKYKAITAGKKILKVSSIPCAASRYRPLKTADKIFSRQLPDLPCQLQLEECSKDLR